MSQLLPESLLFPFNLLYITKTSRDVKCKFRSPYYWRMLQERHPVPLRQHSYIIGIHAAGTAPCAAQATFVYNANSRGAFLKCKHTEYSLKGVDTGNAARCIPTQSGPKHGFSRIHCLSLCERILGCARSYSKEKGSVQRALVMVRRACVDI